MGHHWLLMNCWRTAPTAESEASVMMLVGASGLGCDRREALVSDCLMFANASVTSWVNENCLFSFEAVRRS